MNILVIGLRLNRFSSRIMIEMMARDKELLLVSINAQKAHGNLLEQVLMENLRLNPILIEFATQQEVAFTNPQRKVVYPRDIPSHRIPKKLAGRRPLRIRGFECRKKKPKKGRE